MFVFNLTFSDSSAPHAPAEEVEYKFAAPPHHAISFYQLCDLEDEKLKHIVNREIEHPILDVSFVSL